MEGIKTKKEIEDLDEIAKGSWKIFKKQLKDELKVFSNVDMEKVEFGFGIGIKLGLGITEKKFRE